jgi:hypothetical protein
MLSPTTTATATGCLLKNELLPIGEQKDGELLIGQNPFLIGYQGSFTYTEGRRSIRWEGAHQAANQLLLLLLL